MRENLNKELSDRSIWALVAIAFLSLSGMLVIVFDHDKTKPQSPHELVATAFNQMLPVKEWKPGMGSKPLFYHPAGAGQPVWRPLPAKSEQSVALQQNGQGNFSSNGLNFQKIIR